MVRRLIQISILACAMAGTAAAADFSGDYATARAEGATLVVAQAGNSLTFTHTRLDRVSKEPRTTTFTYVADGVDRTVAGLQGEDRTVNATWENENTLVVRSSGAGAARTERWTIDGSTLRLEMAPDGDRARLRARTIVFQR